MSLHREQKTLHYTPADKDRCDYAYVAFELPTPARRLRVSYRYSAAMSSDQVDGGNVIDLGLFDPAGHAFPGGAGFRGWSGSARSEFTITPTSATPGYRPGPLPAGTYQVILGLYRIWEHGADVTISIEADLDQSDLDEGKGWSQPAGDKTEMGVSALPEPTWLRGDLQSHTVHSDAKGTLEQLTAKARQLELDFLAVTDHNTTSHHPFLPALSDSSLLLIPGQESTTYYGHMNIWGTSRWCDFRCASSEEMREVIELAHSHDALCSINHPKQGGPDWTFSTDLPVDAMEVWQGPWPHRNTESLAVWDRLLNHGRRLPAVGGSDYHCPAGEETNFLRLGQPTTWVLAREHSVAGILEAIAAGRASISHAPNGARISLRADAAGATAEMGGVLVREQGFADKPLEVTLRIDVHGGDWLRDEMQRGARHALHVVADGAEANRIPIIDDRSTYTVRLPVERYVRVELVGDADQAMIPPGAPTGLDLRGWRWALSNPIYVEG